MATLYSPKELSKIYNRIKITYNPSSYSFKDRLVEDTSGTNVSNLMVNIDYDTEQILAELIAKFWKVPFEFPTLGIHSMLTPDEIVFLKEYNTYSYRESYIQTPLNWSSVFVTTDNLIFEPIPICAVLGISLEDFKKLNILEDLITVGYMLTAPYSVAGVLKFITTKMVNEFSYENLYSLQYLKDALNKKDADKMYVNLKNSFLSTVNCPVIHEKGINLTEGWLTSTGTGIAEADSSIDVKSTMYKQALTALYLETIAFGLEMTYLIYSRTDTVTNRKLNEILLGSMRGVSNDIVDLIYKSSKSMFEPAIPLSDDCETRFKEIYEYVYATIPVIDTVVTKAVNHIEYTPIPALFGALVSFAKNYSCRNIRIKQCAILYNYCKTNKLLKATDSEISTILEEMEESFFGKAVAEASSGIEEKSKGKSMLDLSERKSSKGKPMSSSSSHESSSVSQALDGMIDNFRTEMYKFTVKDVYSDNAEAKAKYEAIASSIKLVNTQLTRQIREIKTYNVGGKYAGLSTGKLDRKNIHKYKTDKNIFYQNTYKQKECDLAIGIVLDASGSMSGEGIENGRITMIVLHETLKALGINHSIIDHTCYSGKYNSDLRRYQCFREDKGYKLRKNYALAEITAQSGNCDSGALWFMEKALQRTRNKDKICLIFSDGAPTECTGADLVEQVRHMERNGIKVIGIGINFPSISNYYSEYANGKNLKEMLDITAGILKEYVLTKKD